MAWFVGRLGLRFLSGAGWLLLLPVTVIFHMLGYRRVTVFTDRIGHLAAEVDCFLKEKALGKLSRRHWFIVAPPHRVANRTLLEYWRPHIPIVTSPWLCVVMSVMSQVRGLMSFDISAYVLRLNSTALYYRVCTEWGNRPPLLQLSKKDEERGWDFLQTLGMPRNAWFVCVQAREGGFSPLDEALHRHRNSDILRLVPALELITANGGWCIRVGESTAAPLPSLPHVIDYARHPEKSDWMDIFLCARCRFFLGNSSGLSIVSTVFGVPCALANMIPLSSLGYAPQDISIPKLLRRKFDGRYVSFEEAFDSPVANYRLARLYEAADLDIEENSAQDITELTREMLARMDATLLYEDEDAALQRRFHALLRPGDYGFGASSRVGAAFLRERKNLFSCHTTPV